MQKKRDHACSYVSGVNEYMMIGFEDRDTGRDVVEGNAGGGEGVLNGEGDARGVTVGGDGEWAMVV